MILLLLALGCTGAVDDTGAPDSGTPPITEPRFTLDADVQPLMDEFCTEICHQEPMAESNTFSLMPGETRSEIIDVPAVQVPVLDRVEPYQPELSYLMHKLWGSHTEVGGMGLSMPRDSDMPIEAVSIFEAWIEDGAH